MRKHVLALMALLATCPAAASAADLPDYREGSQTDPANDASLVYSDYGGPPARLLDVRSVHAGFDNATGALTFAFEGSSLVNEPHSGISFAANVSPASPLTGACDVSAGLGRLTILASAGGGYSTYGPATISTQGGAVVANGQIVWSADGTTPRISFSGSELLGRVA